MPALLQGLVIAHLGQGIAVEHEGQVILCQTRRRLETVAVGDTVLWESTSLDAGRIEQVLPRRSVLLRPARGNKTKPVAANIDQVCIVFAIAPLCDFLLLDQYLAVCEHNQLTATLVLNKCDLVDTEQLTPALDDYVNLGYNLHRVTALTPEDASFIALKQAISDKVSIFTGQSGVGKSSLTNALIPNKALKTNTISQTSKLGRHTTTAATLYHLPEGGDIIDSPGVAIFGLAELSAAQLAYGYREFQPLLGQCRFNDCRHLHDKDCAIRDAAETGRISMARYQRFCKLLEKMALIA
ncbi:ribosome small subunit-dependent GTPase A [Methylocucumis oryzae]|uniref:Small ribosomal subunit biogenesis GTPase RsgA n=1 Tax=Methylocucumis oryzae TaxID=1632867 RepID=A0A0F3IJK9_9GAMM|nr:ribosome small subunit-dependent GTPase A [Methylocucumis oryzae]KJV05734.1 ribosome biogenesis GTPase RsgA [Methylocucumis oryzae]